ncbi:MAG: ABC transporter ATP-binding protein [Aquificaceae bacterium]
MIELEDICKSFSKRRLFNGLNLQFNQGKTTAVLGPNASGKTTLVKIILGLVIPDRGRALIDGRDALRDPSCRRMIGYMPQIPEFPENLTVKEIVSMVRDLRGEESKRLDELIELLNLSREWRKRFSSLSGGTKQKVGALVALVFDQPLLILDEPTMGLDPISAYRLRSFIVKEKERGKTIVYISHVMSEVEELADDVIFITEGNVVFQGDMKGLKEATKKEKLEEAILCLLSS